MAYKFKVGDTMQNVAFGSSNYLKLGKVYEVSGDWVRVEYNGGCFGQSMESKTDYKLISKKATFMENLMKAWNNLTITEPNKSRRAAEVTDENNELTSEGRRLYINYLLSKDDGKFDTDVVQPIVKAAEAKKD